MTIDPNGLTIPEVTHHRAAPNGVELHFVSAGSSGSPILLVHGFPESWWAFHRLIPLLARHHRVFAVDLRGFGDSGAARDADGSDAMAGDLHALIAQLGLGPVHLLAQDISGMVGVRLIAAHPGDVLSFTAVETGLPGFGLERLADVAGGGAWHIGVLATPGAADRFLAGRERDLLADFILPAAFADPARIDPADIAELARGYARPGGWSGAHALYAAMLGEGKAITDLVARHPIAVPTMTIDRAGSDFTRMSIGPACSRPVRAETIDGTGHAIALEAPEPLARVLLDFAGQVDRSG